MSTDDPSAAKTNKCILLVYVAETAYVALRSILPTEEVLIDGFLCSVLV